MNRAVMFVLASFTLWAPAGASAAIMYSTEGDGTRLGTINSIGGGGTDIGAFGTSQTWAAAFNNSTGTLYTLINGFSGNSQLASVNQSTGAVTPIGGGLGRSAISLEVSNLGVGYTIDYNTGMLVSINLATGVGANVGSTGIFSTMDLAFDQSGTLWATVGNQFWTVNTTTGASTFKGNASGVSGEIMGIAFDASNNLFATTYTSNSPLYQLNTTTLSATFIGSTGFYYAHGGDILVQQQAVPEPASLAIWGGLGLAGLVAARRRKRFAA